MFHNRKTLFSLFAVFLALSSLLVAEDLDAYSAQQRLYLLQQNARSALLKKIKKEDGSNLDIRVLPVIDYTQLTEKDFMQEIVQDSLQSYDSEIKVGKTNYFLKSLSLDSLRLAIASTKAEVLVAAVTLPTNVDVYIYDKRTPLKVFAHSEIFLEGNQEDLSVRMAEYYAKLAFRKALYRYIMVDAYDLPRDGSPPILKSDVPRGIASYQTVEMINREANANFYVAANWGAALSNGDSGKFWNSSLISLQLAWNFLGNLYIEAAGEISAYNLGVGSIKYLVSDREQPFRFMFGLGGAVLTTRHTFDWDQSNDITGRRLYVVPSATILFPISDVYLKLETRAFLGLDERSQIFTFMPGLHIWF